MSPRAKGTLLKVGLAQTWDAQLPSYSLCFPHIWETMKSL